MTHSLSVTCEESGVKGADMQISFSLFSRRRPDVLHTPRPLDAQQTGTHSPRLVYSCPESRVLNQDYSRHDWHSFSRLSSPRLNSSALSLHMKRVKWERDVHSFCMQERESQCSNNNISDCENWKTLTSAVFAPRHSLDARNGGE